MKCEFCGRPAAKAIRMDNERMFLCRRDYKGVVKELKKQGMTLPEVPFAGTPCGSLANQLVDAAAWREVVRRNPSSLVVLAVYPREDWNLAVETGTTNLASWQELCDRVELARRVIQVNGGRVKVLTVRVQEMLSELGARGWENTPDNRTKLFGEWTSRTAA